MNNYLLCTNSFLDRTLACELEYVTKKNIDSVFILSENHSSIELLDSKVVIKNSIDECMDLCNRVITTNKGVYNLFKKQKKDADLIIGFDPNINRMDNNLNKADSFNCFKKPVIVILSANNYSDSYCVEITINKILSDSGACPLQFYSWNTRRILKVLNRDLFSDVAENSQYDILILGMSCYGHDYINMLSKLKKVCPDLVFICVNGDYSYEELKKYMSLICGNVFMVKSPYILFENIVGKTVPVYNNDTTCQNECIMTTDACFYDKIRNVIFTVLYWPENIKSITKKGGNNHV